MSETRFTMIPDQAATGDLNGSMKTHPDANRLELVGLPFEASLSTIKVH